MKAKTVEDAYKEARSILDHPVASLLLAVLKDVAAEPERCTSLALALLRKDPVDAQAAFAWDPEATDGSNLALLGGIELLKARVIAHHTSDPIPLETTEKEAADV